VEIREIRLEGPQGPEIWVAGADLLDGTPIYDLKPYVPYADARPEARSGFAPAADAQLTVEDPQGLLEALPQTQQEALRGVLAQDPRPHYQKDPERVYGLRFDRWNVKFRVDGNTLWVEKLEE
jgi:hypothetical protein